jgi:hypothetical protein
MTGKYVMEEFIRQLLKPINLLHLTIAGIALLLSLLYRYDGLGLVATYPARKTDLYQASHYMTGLVLIIVGIRLIIEYKAKWSGAILLIIIFVSTIASSVIPTKFWLQHLTTGGIQQVINTVIGIGWILPMLVTAYIAWRWSAKKDN